MSFPTIIVLESFALNEVIRWGIISTILSFMEVILFGRYLRVNENDVWRFWHDKWVNDPSQKEDMSDYFLLEELKEK